MCERWVNPWGKLPGISPFFVSYISEKRWAVRGLTTLKGPENPRKRRRLISSGNRLNSAGCPRFASSSKTA